MATRRHSGNRDSNIFARIINRPISRKSDVTQLWGIAWLIIASILGWYFRIAPTSIFTFIPMGYISLGWHVVLNVIVWIVSCVLPFAYAMFICRNTSIVELYGRMLYAHWPVLLLMLPGMMSNKVSYSMFMSGLSKFDLAASFGYQPMYSTLMLIMVCVVLIWVVYWSYKVFSKVTNRGGIAIFALFVVVMMCSQYLTAEILEAVYRSILQ